MLFAAVSGAPACCIPPCGDENANFITRPSQKLLFDMSGVPQILYNLPLFVGSAAALNEHRWFLSLYGFKNMAVIYILYTLKLKC